MGEVIHYDFRGDKGITDRVLFWPEIQPEEDLIDQVKNIYAAMMLADGSTPAEVTDRLSMNLERCLNSLGQVSDDLLKEIFTDAARKARELRKEII